MIRIANINDIESINYIGEQLHENFREIYHIEKELDSNIAIVLVNVKNNQIRGYLYALDFGDNIDLLSICVDESYRNKNIGSELLKYLIDNNSYQKTITLEVSSKNVYAIEFYKKFNFKIVNIRKNYYKDSDAYLMKRGI